MASAFVISGALVFWWIRGMARAMPSCSADVALLALAFSWSPAGVLNSGAPLAPKVHSPPAARSYKRAPVETPAPPFEVVWASLLSQLLLQGQPIRVALSKTQWFPTYWCHLSETFCDVAIVRW